MRAMSRASPSLLHRLVPALLVMSACTPLAHARAGAHGQVEAAARLWLAGEVARQGIAPLRLDLEVIEPVRPPGDCPQPWQVDALKGRVDRLQLVATCTASGEQARYVARTRVIARVVVAREDIAAGQPIDARLLTLAEQDIAGVDGVLADTAQAIGRSSRRPLRAGRLLRAQYLHAEIGVRRGQPVRIIGGAPGFQVSIAGTAMDDAGIGEATRVRNASTGRILTAVVSGEGTVSTATAR